MHNAQNQRWNGCRSHSYPYCICSKHDKVMAASPENFLIIYTTVLQIICTQVFGIQVATEALQAARCAVHSYEHGTGLAIKQGTPLGACLDQQNVFLLSSTFFLTCLVHVEGHLTASVASTRTALPSLLDSWWVLRAPRTTQIAFRSLVLVG